MTVDLQKGKRNKYVVIIKPNILNERASWYQQSPLQSNVSMRGGDATTETFYADQEDGAVEVICLKSKEKLGHENIEIMNHVTPTIIPTKHSKKIMRLPIEIGVTNNIMQSSLAYIVNKGPQKIEIDFPYDAS